MTEDLPSREFSEGELKLSTWLVKHRILFWRLIKIALIIIDIIIIIFALTLWSFYINESTSYKNALLNLTTPNIDWPSLQELTKAKSLTVEEVASLSSGLNQADFVARISNPNTRRWLSHFEYRFVWEGKATDWQSSFIMPGDIKHILALAVDTVPPPEARLDLRNLVWKRIGHTYTMETLNERNQIIVIDTQFISEVFSLTPPSPVSAVRFTVENQSPFIYREAGFNILLKSGFEYIGVNFISVANLEGAIERTIERRWFRGLPKPAQVIIEPAINYFDDNLILL